MVDFTSDTLSGDIRRCILKKKMDLGNIGGFRVPKKALFSGFQPFFGHFKGPEWCQTKIPGHAIPAEQSPTITERICPDHGPLCTGPQAGLGLFFVSSILTMPKILYDP